MKKRKKEKEKKKGLRIPNLALLLFTSDVLAVKGLAADTQEKRMQTRPKEVLLLIASV